MRKRKPSCKARNEWLALVTTAFGVGLVLALLCSPRLALFVAAVALIYVGTSCRR